MNYTMFSFADLFSNELFFEEDSLSVENIFLQAKGEAQQEKETSEYLQKGARIRSLAKDNFARQTFPLTDITKRLFQKPFCNIFCMKDLLNEISKRVVRPILRNIEPEKDLPDGEAIRALKELTPHIKWGLFTYSQLMADSVFSHPKEWFPATCREKGIPSDWLSGTQDAVLYLCSESFPGIIICGTKNKKLDKERRYRFYPNLQIMDLSYAISFILFCSVVLEGICSGEYLDFVSFSEMQTNALRIMGSYPAASMREETGLMPLDNRLVLIEFPIAGFDDPNKHYNRDERMHTAFSYPDEKGVQQVKDYFARKGCRAFFLSDPNSPFDETEALCAYIMKQKDMSAGFEEAFAPFQSSMPLDKISFLKKWLENLKEKDLTPVCMRYMDVFLYALTDLPNDHSADTADMLIGHLRQSDIGMPKLFLRSGAFYYLSNSYQNFKPVSYFLSLFLETCREYKNVIETEHEQSSHARAFETKKNIPKKVLTRMETSILNRHFGYVEYDETCDIEKIDVVEQQIDAFVNTYFPNTDLKTVSIRFRKIGHMRSVKGLYYVKERCICLSVNHVTSFVHEFAHCYDYLSGCLSDTHRHKEFRPVYDRYCRCLKNAMLKDDTIRQLMKSKHRNGTYEEYCMKETEVFARCFEMFCRDELRMDCSICKEDEEFYFAYPQDEELEELVRDYYSQILQLDKQILSAS